MKHGVFTLTLLSIAALAAGCGQKPATQLDTVTVETADAGPDVKVYTFTEKTAYTDQLKGRLAALDKDVDQLAAKIEKSSDAVKAEAKPKLQDLRDHMAQLTKQLDAAQNATESTWDKIEKDTKKDCAAVKDEFQQTRQWVSDKIAP